MKKELHLLTEVIEHYTADRKHAAMDEYLNSEAHTTFLIAGELATQCKHSTKRIEKGEIAPHLDICCCGDTFAQILLGSAKIKYSSLDVPYEYDEANSTPTVAMLEDEEFERLMRMKDDRLAIALEKEYACERVSFVHTHLEDDEVQRQYYKAVTEHFRRMAIFAKEFGSESAKVWLDALRLLQPKLNPINVANAYARAEEAQGMLWIDLQFNALKRNGAKKTAKKR